MQPKESPPNFSSLPLHVHAPHLQSSVEELKLYEHKRCPAPTPLSTTSRCTGIHHTINIWDHHQYTLMPTSVNHITDGTHKFLLPNQANPPLSPIKSITHLGPRHASLGPPVLPSHVLATFENGHSKRKCLTTATYQRQLKPRTCCALITNIQASSASVSQATLSKNNSYKTSPPQKHHHTSMDRHHQKPSSRVPHALDDIEPSTIDESHSRASLSHQQMTHAKRTLH